METGETGGILLDGEYYYGWTHRPASSSFLTSPSSFLALTQEKKQKKVKASGTPANFPSLRKDYQGRRPIIELNGSAYLTPPSGYPANRGRRPTSQPRKGPFLASRQEKKIREEQSKVPAHAPFFIKELQHQPIIQHLCIAKVQTKTNVLCVDAWRWRDLVRDGLRRTRWWVPWSCTRDGSLARGITGPLVGLMRRCMLSQPSAIGTCCADQRST